MACDADEAMEWYEASLASLVRMGPVAEGAHCSFTES